MMDDTLIIVSLEPWKRSHNSIHESLRAHTQKLDTAMCPDKVKKSQESCTVPVSVPQANTLADDHQTFQLLHVPHPLAQTISGRLRIRHWNSDTTSPPHISNSKRSDLQCHHNLAD